jgi:hypothetical protein
MKLICATIIRGPSMRRLRGHDISWREMEKSMGRTPPGFVIVCAELRIESERELARLIRRTIFALAKRWLPGAI